MDNKIIIVVVFIVIICVITYIYKSFFQFGLYKEHYETDDLEINVLDLKMGEKIEVIMENMLRNINALFTSYCITYAINNINLDSIPGKEVISWNNDANLVISNKDEDKLIALIPKLYQMGYGLSKFNYGYNVYPLNGLEIPFYNRKWNYSNQYIDDGDPAVHGYPYINIFIRIDV